MRLLPLAFGLSRPDKSANQFCGVSAFCTQCKIYRAQVQLVLQHRIGTFFQKDFDRRRRSIACGHHQRRRTVWRLRINVGILFQENPNNGHVPGGRCVMQWSPPRLVDIRSSLDQTLHQTQMPFECRHHQGSFILCRARIHIDSRPGHEKISTAQGSVTDRQKQARKAGRVAGIRVHPALKQSSKSADIVARNRCEIILVRSRDNLPAHQQRRTEQTKHQCAPDHAAALSVFLNRRWKFSLVIEPTTSGLTP